LPHNKSCPEKRKEKAKNSHSCHFIQPCPNRTTTDNRQQTTDNTEQSEKRDNKKASTIIWVFGKVAAFSQRKKRKEKETSESPEPSSHTPPGINQQKCRQEREGQTFQSPFPS